MTAAPSSQEPLSLWPRLLAASNEMERALRRRLRAQFGTTLPRFEVLAALGRAPEGLSMSELSRRLMVSNGNTTMLVGALEKQGHVRRFVSASDRRSFTVELTDAGREALSRMASLHTAWVCELLSGIDEGSAAQLSRLLHDARLAIHATAARDAGGARP